MNDQELMEFAAGVHEALDLQEPVYIQLMTLPEWVYWTEPDRGLFETVEPSTVGSWNKLRWDTEGVHLVFLREGLPDDIAREVLAHEMKHCQQGERIRAGEPIDMPTFADEIFGIKPQVEAEADEFAISYTGKRLTAQDWRWIEENLTNRGR